MAAPLLVRGIPLLRLQLQKRSSAIGLLLTSLSKPSFCTAVVNPSHHDNVTTATTDNTAITGANKDTPKFPRWDSPDYRRWKDKEAEILSDIEPITLLTKEILHSERYLDGERLDEDDEKAVVDKLLAYHPHSEDKIGSGLDSIMVDRHPQFRNSRCLFVVRTDGGWIDFSYQKCIRAYIRDKYPSYAEKFIREHFKRTSS